MSIKDRIIELMKEKSYIPLTLDDFVIILDSDIDTVSYALEELKNEYIVRTTKKQKYDLLAKDDVHVGKIEIKRNGYGFIVEKETDETYYVSKFDINKAFNDDIVLFKVINDNATSSYKKEARVLEVLEHSIKEVLGTIKKNKKGLYFEAIDSDLNVLVLDYKNAKVNDICVLTISKYKGKNTLEGSISKIITNEKEKDSLIKELCFKYDFHYEFDKAIIDEANSILPSIEEEKKKRKVISDNIYTIDSDEAKDFDDAISVRLLENGNFYLGVYIADVSYYVKEDSLLDKEALYRGCSVYLANLVLPMLPERLCNNLCSLKEKEDKLAIACEMEIDSNGKVIDNKIFQCVINSSHRLTYSLVNRILDGNKDDIDKYSDIYDNIINAYKLSEILTKARTKRGSLEFETKEPYIVLDENEVVLDISIRERGKAERLIEEAMLIANEVVASTLYHLDLPSIYRIHEKPKLESYLNLISILKGLDLDINPSPYRISNYDLQDILAEIDKKDDILGMLVLRTMMKAKYSKDNIGHFGLASSCYTHFTSPIRRYPDLLVHRLLRKYLFDGNLDYDISYQNKIDEIAKKSSIKERKAIDFERDIKNDFLAKYMSKYIGCNFTGRITSVNSFGMFVTLDNTVEGLVHISTLPGYYDFDSKAMALVKESNSRNKHIKSKYRLGEKIRVSVNSVDLKTRQISFIVVK